MKKPEPVNKNVVCSVCGLDWDKHKLPKPTVEDCVELLKAELKTRPPRHFSGIPYQISSSGYSPPQKLQ